MPVTIGPFNTSDDSPEVDMDKVSKYEYFLNEVLRSDLKTTLERRDELYNQVAQYMELQTVLEKVGGAMNADGNSKLKTKVDIGSNFYVQAEIPDLKTVTVDVGCGIWLPMSSEDAIAFCEKKVSFLNSRVNDLTQQELGIKAQINIVLEGLKEIQRISFPQPKPTYET